MFINNDNLNKVLKEKKNLMYFDWDKSSGNTMIEKYHPFHAKLVELTNYLISKGLSGYFYVIGGPEVCYFLEQSPFYVPRSEYEPQGLTEIAEIGTLSRKWKVFNAPLLEQGALILSCYNNRDLNKVGTLIIDNFIK